MPKKRDPDARRASIELAAAELFADQGYAATSTSQIARKAGVAEGTIFRHFRNKKALLLGVVQPLLKTFFAPIATRSLKTLLERRYDSTEGFLSALWADRVQLISKHPQIARIIFQEASLHPEVAQSLRDVFARSVIEPFLAQIRQLQEDGHLDPDLPPEIAMQHIVLTYAGTLAVTKVFEFDLGRTLDELEPYLVGMLAKGLAP